MKDGTVAPESIDGSLSRGWYRNRRCFPLHTSRSTTHASPACPTIRGPPTSARKCETRGSGRSVQGVQTSPDHKFRQPSVSGEFDVSAIRQRRERRQTSVASWLRDLPAMMVGLRASGKPQLDGDVVEPVSTLVPPSIERRASLRGVASLRRDGGGLRGSPHARSRKWRGWPR
jgi:hypothetical protein